jgi:hypothetical protein
MSHGLAKAAPPSILRANFSTMISAIERTSHAAKSDTVLRMPGSGAQPARTTGGLA